ncbi:MAG TPA: ATPase, T2SS/T4P/T4SS family [Planctomycetota bacterium]|nr:ATPase, T2SS/T4P/T4SS family [Planctomycetota bacterium]
MPGRTDPQLVELLNLMEAYEGAVRDLYESFAEKIPGRAAFWRQLAVEERGHCRMLARLSRIAAEEPLGVEDCDTKAAAVRRAAQASRLRMEDIAQNGVSPVRALAMAQELETAMNEARFFDQFSTASEQATEILEELRVSTDNHARRIAELIRERSRYSGLVDRGVVTDEQLEEAMRSAADKGIRVETVLQSACSAGRDEILASLADFHGCQPYRLGPTFVPPGELRDAAIARQDRLNAALAIPVGLNGHRVVVAMADPKDVVRRDELQRLFEGRRVEYRVGLAEEIEGALKRLSLSAPAPGPEPAATLGEDPDLAEIDDDSEIARLLNRLIEEAHSRGASDIHFEPSAQGEVLVRCRVDGALQRLAGLPRSQRGALISRIKIMAGLDITERRRPQSGKIRMARWGGPDIEVRVETYPTSSGAEDASLRLLAAASAKPFEALGLSERNRSELAILIEQPHGIILCVGPTGSGKTTTLHSALARLNRGDLRTLTAEDPVEIVQPGLRQVQMNPKAGLTFATALRSFLRADPDVIMIGEMRDRETAGIAVEASLTGHLVFSTLHTNSAPETVVRLLDMGIDPYSFADALLGVLAQRLVRTICPRCRIPRKLEPAELASLRAEYGRRDLFDALGISPGHQVAAPNDGGCADCNGTSYLGRMAAHELLVVSDEIRALISHRAGAAEIRDLALEQGMRTLRQDGIEKFLGGHTTMEEVRAVCSR